MPAQPVHASVRAMACTKYYKSTPLPAVLLGVNFVLYRLAARTFLASLTGCAISIEQPLAAGLMALVLYWRSQVQHHSLEAASPNRLEILKPILLGHVRVHFLPMVFGGVRAELLGDVRLRRFDEVDHRVASLEVRSRHFHELLVEPPA